MIGAIVKIFDRDLDRDDLIGYGVTDNNGRFTIAWTAKPMDPLDRTVKVYAKYDGSIIYGPSLDGQ